MQLSYRRIWGETQAFQGSLGWVSPSPKYGLQTMTLSNLSLIADSYINYNWKLTLVFFFRDSIHLYFSFLFFAEITNSIQTSSVHQHHNINKCNGLDSNPDVSQCISQVIPRWSSWSRVWVSEVRWSTCSGRWTREVRDVLSRRKHFVQAASCDTYVSSSLTQTFPIKSYVTPLTPVHCDHLISTWSLRQSQCCRELLLGSSWKTTSTSCQLDSTWCHR